MRSLALLPLILTACSPAAKLESQDLGTIVLAPPSVATKDGGWPATGIARLPKGGWIIGHEGRVGEKDTVHRTRLVEYSPDFSRKVGEIELTGIIPNIKSIQGIAWSGNGLWITDPANASVHKLVGGRVIDTIRVGFEVNGLAIAGNRLYLGALRDRLIRVYNLPARQLERTLWLTAVPDQLAVKGNVLLSTTGPNGRDGEVHATDLRSGRWIGAYGPLSGMQAIEGIYLEGEDAFIVNDGGFHRRANPSKTFVRKYRLAKHT